MKSLRGLQGSPTWWDNHRVITALTRLLFFLVGLAPTLSGFIYLEYEAYASGSSPHYHITPISPWWVVGYLAIQVVVGFLFINLSVSFNS